MNAAGAALLGIGLRAATRSSATALHLGLSDIRRAQDGVLAHLLAGQENTDYGRHHGLKRGMTRDEFRAHLPFTSFDEGDLAVWIDRQHRAPSANILSPGGARTFQKTSGSSGPSKRIPYNRLLLRSFERYFCVWLNDLLTHGPKFNSMRTFVSISPAVVQPNQGGENGLADDADYLSPLFQRLIRPLLSVPLSLKTVAEAKAFRDLACAYLASDADLEVISVWHPSFFSLLWQHLLDQRLRVAAILDEDLLLPKNTAAAARLRDPGLQPHHLWPRLKLISAWSAGHSAGPARALQALFPDVLFQGKGLLATEAPMTLPLVGLGSVPFLTEVLFEFIDEQKRILWLDELTVGCTYQMVISQFGGLLRYAIGDQVVVTGQLPAGAPLLEFCGRHGEVCDLVGEKLTAAYLISHQAAFLERYPTAVFSFLPRLAGLNKPSYVLLFEPGGNVTSELAGELAAWWETRLEQSYHYQYARTLGQLGPVTARAVGNLQYRLLEYFQRSRQMKAGDIKLRILVSSMQDAAAIWEGL